MKDTVIAFLGCGNMGRSLIGGLIAGGHPPAGLRAAEPDASQRDRAAKLFDIEIHADNRDAVSGADVVVLAVKPQFLREAVDTCSDALRKQLPLVISIAAGVRLATLEAWVGEKLALVRAMPNTPALVRAAATALCANARVRPHQRELAEAIMGAVGSVVWLDQESLLDAVTAVSGTGPAYFFLLMEALQQAAVKEGLTPDQARLLVQETAFGAAVMARGDESDPATLRRQVTSPGGTTERAMEVLLKEGDMTGLLERAVNAARRRSEELAGQFGAS